MTSFQNILGNKTFVVIGGDDNYKGRDEEDSRVLSRWARRKIMSQFTEDFLDGSTSFVFSWGEKHRPIHEEALLHLLLPGSRGKKFVPKPRPVVPEPVGPKSLEGPGKNGNDPIGKKELPDEPAGDVAGTKPRQKPVVGQTSQTTHTGGYGDSSQWRTPEVHGATLSEKPNPFSPYSASTSTKEEWREKQGGISLSSGATSMHPEGRRAGEAAHPPSFKTPDPLHPEGRRPGEAAHTPSSKTPDPLHPEGRRPGEAAHPPSSKTPDAPRGQPSYRHDGRNPAGPGPAHRTRPDGQRI